ncbi:GGDEF domain-containing protein [Agrobacterium sp. ES01]|uniref:GGDEF domain-containing protein n=1 Tax=Agrobacterium sp. ES01 TaxID=3420714 RepID=UPI003D0BC0D7
MELFKRWLSLQVDLGKFHGRRAVYGFAMKMTFRAVILASIFNIVALPVCYLLGLLPMSFSDAVKLSVAFSWIFGGAVSGSLALVTGNVIRELSVSRSRYARLSRVDMLSGLLNRRAFSKVLEEADENASLAIFDLDRFKSINDCHGHAVGDAVIKAVSGVIRDVFPQPSVCARLGGEEFGVIILAGSVAERHAKVEEVRARIADQPILSDHASITATVSAGIAEFGDGRPADIVYTAADRALYLAKAGGRNRVVHEGEGHELFARRETSLAPDLVIDTVNVASA